MNESTRYLQISLNSIPAAILLMSEAAINNSEWKKKAEYV